MATVPGEIFYGNYLAPGSVSGFTVGTVATLDTATKKVAVIITAPYSGTLHSFEVRLGAVGNTPDNGLRLSFQSLNSSGDPNGTQSQYRDVTTGFTAQAWLTPPGPLTSDGTDTGVKRTVSQNDQFACVIEFVNFVAGDSININSFNINSGNVPSNFYRDFYNGTSWAKAVEPLMIALKYDTLGYVPLQFTFPIVTQDVSTWLDTTNPDERGMRFTLPFDFKLSAVLLRGRFVAATADSVVATLYNASDTIIGVGTWLSEFFRAPTTMAWMHFVSDPSLVLTKDLVYRISWEPEASAGFAIEGCTIPSADYLKCFQGGSTWYKTSRDEGGAWTDDQTSRYWMVLQGEEISGSAGGGSFAFIG